MEKDKRELIISWLETNQGNGFFEGFEEENMNFKKMSDEDLSWYYDNWIVEDIEEEELLNQKKVELVNLIKTADNWLTAWDLIKLISEAKTVEEVEFFEKSETMKTLHLK